MSERESGPDVEERHNGRALPGDSLVGKASIEQYQFGLFWIEVLEHLVMILIGMFEEILRVVKFSSHFFSILFLGPLGYQVEIICVPDSVLRLIFVSTSCDAAANE
ncbi:MAG TPA: hypothetical protein VKB50_09805 [Vicinamibacterales bacterium]|nr:hypothetical protein [Vicinamibacterales bacterium]